MCWKGIIRSLYYYIEATNECYNFFHFLYLIVIVAFTEGVCKNLLDVYICWDINILYLEFTHNQNCKSVK